jgi:hypothetical protein
MKSYRSGVLFPLSNRHDASPHSGGHQSLLVRPC